jgi:7-carboxy-7-deazaguanine synthase
MTAEQVIERVGRFRAPLVEVTGGEPLLQPETPALVMALADRCYKVLIETNGSLPLKGIDERATVIMDLKCPGSGMSEHMLWENLDALRPHDEIKFVLTDRYDYDWALDIIKTHRLSERHVVHLSPAYGMLEPAELAAWMLEPLTDEALARGLNVRFQLQLHKYIWPGVERGV